MIGDGPQDPEHQSIGPKSDSCPDEYDCEYRQHGSVGDPQPGESEYDCPADNRREGIAVVATVTRAGDKSGRDRNERDDPPETRVDTDHEREQAAKYCVGHAGTEFPADDRVKQAL